LDRGHELPVKALFAKTTLPEERGIIRRLWPFIAIFMALFALHLTCASSEIGGHLGGDSVVYYLLGKALATGKGYVDLYLPGEPIHTQYPPLFPLLLAPFHLIFEKPLFAMHVMVCFCNALAASALGAWAGRRLSNRGLGLLFAAIFGTMPHVYLQSLHLLTEPIYMAFCYLALLALPEKNQAAGLTAKRFAAISILVIAAYFTRSAGIALLPAAAFGLARVKARLKLRTKNFPAWVLLVMLFVLPAALWSFRNHLVETQGAGYVNQFLLKDPYRVDLGRAGIKDLGERFLNNARQNLPLLSAQAITPTSLLPHRTLHLLPLLLVAAGMIKEWRRGDGAAELFFLLSLLITLVWPFQEDLRFLLPILPLAGFYALSGLLSGAQALMSKLKAKKRQNLVMPAAATLLLGAQLLLLAPLVSERFTDRTMPREPVMVAGYGEWSEPVVNWSKYDFLFNGDHQLEVIKLHLTGYLIVNLVAAEITTREAVILSRKPMWTYHLSGRKSVPILHDPRPEIQWNHMVENQVDYIVTGLDETILNQTFEQSRLAGRNRFTPLVQVRFPHFEPRPPILIIKVNRD